MPVFLAIIFFHLISEGIASEPTPPSYSFANDTWEINLAPNRSFEFFPNARKCCPYTSAYNSTRRVCLFSTPSKPIEESKWKEYGDPKGSERLHGPPECGESDVLVDYELVVKTYSEEDEWESAEEGGDPATNSSRLVERVEKRIKVLSAHVIGANDETWSNITLLPDGTMEIGDRSYDSKKLCIDGRDDGFEDAFYVTIRACVPSEEWCSGKRSCVRKCCQDGESMLEKDVAISEDGGSTMKTVKRRRCAPSSLGFPVPKELSRYSPVGVYMGHPCGVRKKYVLMPELDKDDTWYLQLNGSLVVPKIQPKYFPQTENCLETIYAPKDKMDSLYAYLCFPESGQGEPDQMFEKVDRVVYPGALLISCFFIFATLVVYGLLPSLRNLHGLTLISHASCLLAAFICLIIVKLTYTMSRNAIGCKVLGFSILFTFMAALSWLNVMCFDIWWTFGGFRGRRGLRPGQRGGSGNSGSGLKGNVQRYIFYSLYAWLLPLIITGLTVLADELGEDYLPYAPPGIGSKKCWFEDNGKLAVLIHFVAPSTILLIADVVMFTLTALRCWKVKAEIHRMQHSDKDDARKDGEGFKMFGRRWWKQKYQADKDRLTMNLKLCAAMGVNWSLEIASWWLSRDEFQSQRLLPIATWYASDVANCLHGVFVFVVFVGKKKIMKQLWKRIKDLCGCCKKKVARDSTINSSSQQDSSKLSSVHGNSPGREERMYNFENGQETKISGLRNWFIKKKNYKCKNRPLSNSSTTCTSISEDRSRARVSYTP